MTDTVFIRGLELAAVIGVYEIERQAPQRLVANLEVDCDTRAAASSDAVADTLDYQQITRDIERFVESTQFYLVETLANRLADRLLADYPITALSLELTKPDVMAPDVGVRIRRP